MIIIDKRNSVQKLIVTVTENSSNNESNYRFDVYSLFSQKSFSINLPANTSVFINRFDEFIIDTPSWETGEYTYNIIEIGTEKNVETGMLKVIDEETYSNQFVSIESTQEEEEWAIYENK